MRRADRLFQQKKVELRYTTPAGDVSERTIRPLGLYFWGRTWTIGAWCELRDDYRNFRVDRIEAITKTDERFELVSPVTLEEYIAEVKKP